MAIKKPERKLDLYILAINFTALQTHVTSKRSLTRFLKTITKGLVDKDAIELQVSDCFRGGHRDGVRFQTTNKKKYEKALKYLTKQQKKGWLSIQDEVCPAMYHTHHNEGAKYGSLKLNY